MALSDHWAPLGDVAVFLLGVLFCVAWGGAALAVLGAAAYGFYALSGMAWVGWLAFAGLLAFVAVMLYPVGKKKRPTA